MKKTLLILLCAAVAGGCTIKKEAGSWNVKKTIIDDVKDSVDETKNLATDLNDANSDLSGKKTSEPSATPENVSDTRNPAPASATAPAEKAAASSGSVKKSKKSKKKN